jgi:hypothetical protein
MCKTSLLSDWCWNVPLYDLILVGVAGFPEDETNGLSYAHQIMFAMMGQGLGRPSEPFGNSLPRLHIYIHIGQIASGVTHLALIDRNQSSHYSSSSVDPVALWQRERIAFWFSGLWFHMRFSLR